MVCKRLRWKLDNLQFFSAFQSGFRATRSTTDHDRLDTDICNALVAKHHLLAVSLDIEKAYEMVCRNRVVKLLADQQISGPMLSFVRNLLQDRLLRVRLHDAISDPVKMENGLPQGSVLSVLLFLVAINEATAIVDRPVYVFADDITLTCSGNDPELTSSLMQQALDALQTWTTTSGFPISESKTEAIVFLENA